MEKLETTTGIPTLARSIAKEIKVELKRLELFVNVTKVSFIGHSLGGLI